MDIESLYKAVPQLAKVFRIMDKIGEGKCSAQICLYFAVHALF